MNPKFKIINNSVHDKTNNHPMTFVTLSKLVRPMNHQKNALDFNDLGLTNSIFKTRDSTRDKISSNDDILVLFPDTALAIEMIISSMLSPNDMVTKNLLYHAPDELDISPTMKQELMKIIKDHMNKEYDFESKFSEIIKESLFTKGAYVEVIIPEASFDDFINKPNFESQTGLYNLSKRSYLGDLSLEDIQAINNMTAKHKISPELASRFNLKNKKHQQQIDPVFNLENYGNGQYNFNSTEKNNNYNKTLKIPEILDKPQTIKSAIQKVQELAKEIFNHNSTNQQSYIDDARKLNIDKIFKKTIKPKNNKTVEFISDIHSASRKSIGKPLVMKIPTESVIPVHAINDPTIKVGYFIAVDGFGEPLSASKEIDDMVKQYSPYGDNYRDGKEFIQKGVDNLYSITETDPMFEENEKIYSHIVDEMIKRKIKNGDLGELATIQSNYDIYRMMFYRTLRNRETKLIFVPDELVCYWAFNYRPNGTGESLLERVAPLFSIRGILLMVTILSYIKNSTTTTKVRIDLDENESLPEARAEEIISYLMQNREVQFPLGMMRIYELQDWAIRSGYQFEVNSPNLPELKIESEQRNPDFKLPDNELDDLFFEKILNTFGIVPEMVKQGMDPDFATTTTLRNVLNNQRIKEKQKVFNSLASKAIQKYLKSDPTLKEKIVIYLYDNIDALLSKYIEGVNDSEEEIKPEDISKETQETIIGYIVNSLQDNLSVTLPEPRSTDAPLLFNAVQAEFQQINDIIDGLFTNGAFDSDENGQLRDHMELIKGIMSFQMKLDRLSEYNLLPEAIEIFNLGDNGETGSNLFNNFISNRDAFIQNTSKLIAKIKGQTNIADTALNIIDQEQEQSQSSEETGSQSSQGNEYSQDNPDEFF